jgi:SAM-dependent methyltransferase
MGRWRSQHSPDVLIPALRQWFTTPLGRTVLQEEQGLIHDAVMDSSTARNYLLKLSAIPERLPLNKDEIHQRQVHVGSSSQYGYSQVLDAIGDFHQLPIANESQDVVILHHLLEFVENPHRVLREVERVIVPHGKVIICGINPYSLLAVRGFLGRLKRSPVWQNHSLTTSRIQDWLSLLGFDVNSVEYAFHRFPVNSPAWFLNHQTPSSRIPMGGIFVLSATKYRAPLTPSADSLRQRAQILRHPAMYGATRGADPQP